MSTRRKAPTSDPRNSNDKGVSGKPSPSSAQGLWALSKVQELHSVAGQTLSVRCQYPPKGWPYQSKGWCKEVSKFKCVRLVTSSSPRTLAWNSRFSIWDNPAAGFFIVTMTGLKEEDSGHYWCRIYHASGNSVSKSIRFYLAVSPASPSRQATWAPRDLVSSQTQSCVSPTGRAGETSRASSAITAPSHWASLLSVPLSSRQRNSTSCSSPAAPSALVPLLCGLLVAKNLVLSALLVWSPRSCASVPAQGGPSFRRFPAGVTGQRAGKHEPGALRSSGGPRKAKSKRGRRRLVKAKVTARAESTFSYVAESRSRTTATLPQPGRGGPWRIPPAGARSAPLVGPPPVLTPSQRGLGRVRPPRSRGRLSALAS
ncbi:PREDICTED: natural cytotoxicity triggering receptor 2 [Ceratotherium simum simum]|uniref:Natural cytotoxicity triggering receptor 2 n=1 Tax=Ceratotherium simum simum TaxID=73337 RepID=A0ABM1CER4_CERSS|nr:PREDICTED: natural cytotoxicity triggering receptor 2 [Ceratotherium simum simum]